ncbi:MAG TPA: TolC family protein [Terriglobales bacterium]|jgi:outer membrane protein TolC
MKPVSRCLSYVLLPLIAMLLNTIPLAAEPLPLKRAVDLALAHSAAMGGAAADEQRAFASFREVHNEYLPQLSIGSGLGKTWGFPLSLEGLAPSLFNVNSQSSLFNPALRDFVRAAKTEWQAAGLQTKDQRSQTIQDTVLAYLELNKWESMRERLQEEQADAAKMEDIVKQRVEAGVDSQQALTQAQLSSARVRYRLVEARGSIDVLRARLSQLTGVPAASIETVADSVPALPEVKQEDDLAAKSVQANAGVQAAEIRASAQDYRARGEHRSLWPTFDFAAQYATLARYNNYDQYFRAGSFQRNNATIGVVIRFPFLNLSQHAHAQAADAEAIRAHKDAEAAKNRVSEQTLQLQRSVEQLSAAQDVANLEYQVAQSGVQAVQIRVDAGSATLHELDDARNQSNERYYALQNSSFELERARVALLRATGELDGWLGLSK